MTFTVLFLFSIALMIFSSAFKKRNRKTAALAAAGSGIAALAAILAITTVFHPIPGNLFSVGGWECGLLAFVAAHAILYTEEGELRKMTETIISVMYYVLAASVMLIYFLG